MTSGGGDRGVFSCLGGSSVFSLWNNLIFSARFNYYSLDHDNVVTGCD